MKTVVTFKIIPHYESGSVRVTVNTKIDDEPIRRYFDIPASSLIGGVRYPTIDVLRVVGGDKIKDILDNPGNYSYSIRMVNAVSIYYNESLLEDAISVMKQIYELQHKVKIKDINQADKKFVDYPPKAETFKIPRNIYDSIVKDYYEEHNGIQFTVNKVMHSDEEYDECYTVSIPITQTGILDRIVCKNTVLANRLDGEPYLKFDRTFRLFHINDKYVYYIGGGVSCKILFKKPTTFKIIEKGVKIRVDCNVVRNIIIAKFNAAE